MFRFVSLDHIQQLLAWESEWFSMLFSDDYIV
jgi:hypothetical protein